MEDNIIDLQRKVKVLNYENNKMYKEIKEKDKEIERLNNIINGIEKWLKENIIKEVREFVEKWEYKDGDESFYFDINTNPDDLLRILDKGE